MTKCFYDIYNKTTFSSMTLSMTCVIRRKKKSAVQMSDNKKCRERWIRASNRSISQSFRPRFSGVKIQENPRGFVIQVDSSLFDIGEVFLQSVRSIIFLCSMWNFITVWFNIYWHFIKFVDITSFIDIISNIQINRTRHNIPPLWDNSSSW